MTIRIAAARDNADHRRLADSAQVAEQVDRLSEVIKIAFEHLQNDDPRRARLTLESALNRRPPEVGFDPR
jgi:hypothetical protein